MSNKFRVEAQESGGGGVLPGGGMSEEEIQQLEQSAPPAAAPGNTLEVLWADYQRRGQALTVELTLADSQNRLYSVSVAPDGQQILVYPIQQIMRPDYNSGEMIPPAQSGEPNWDAVTQKYFPGGFTELPSQFPEPDERTMASSRKSPNDFWMRVLANVLRGYSRRTEILRKLNPYLR